MLDPYMVLTAEVAGLEYIWNEMNPVGYMDLQAEPENRRTR